MANRVSKVINVVIMGGSRLRGLTVNLLTKKGGSPV